jgi:hypothetical protein
MEDESAPERGDFDQWLTPADALALLPEDWGLGHSTDAILTNLKIAAITSVARSGLIVTSNGDRRVSFHRIPAHYWDEQQWTKGSHALWVTGQISFHRGSLPANATFSGIRFDPVAFFDIFDIDRREAEIDSADVTGARAPLSEAALKGWAELFREAYPDGSEALARRSVDGMFPDKHVSRERLRRILPERPRGRRLKNSN